MRGALESLPGQRRPPFMSPVGCNWEHGRNVDPVALAQRLPATVGATRHRAAVGRREPSASSCITSASACPAHCRTQFCVALRPRRPLAKVLIPMVSQEILVSASRRPSRVTGARAGQEPAGRPPYRRELHDNKGSLAAVASPGVAVLCGSGTMPLND